MDWKQLLEVGRTAAVGWLGMACGAEVKGGREASAGELSGGERLYTRGIFCADCFFFLPTPSLLSFLRLSFSFPLFAQCSFHLIIYLFMHQFCVFMINCNI
jgi:hypothetical protein